MEKPTMTQEVTLTIDGREIRATPGDNLVKVARAHDINIPSLCYFEHLDQPLGTCRVCMCNVDGRIVPACMQRVHAGMEVAFETPKLSDMRHAVLEMMFAEGNHVCPACPKSGDCDLQRLGYEMEVRTVRFPHLFKDRYIDLNAKRTVVDTNRCVKCARCVEEVRTDDGKQVYSFCNRGNETVVAIDYEQEARLTDAQARKAMRVCPTGAIIVRGEPSWTRPFGDRRYDLHPIRGPETLVRRKKTKATPNKRDKKTVATISLAGCYGCHMSMLDTDLGLIDRVDIIEFNKSPLNDIKEFTKRCDLGIIEGGVCNSDNVEVLKEFRRQCDVLVCIGECAVWGGVPALRNTIPLRECLEETYLHCESVEPGQGVVPFDDDLPKLLDRVYACNEIVKIDHYIPGCPPNADIIWKSVANILWDEDNSILYSDFKYD